MDSDQDDTILSVIVGATAEILDYRLCMSFFAACSLLICFCTIFRCRADVKKVYETDKNLSGATDSQEVLCFVLF